MIRIRVDAVLRVLDGFTGKSLPPAAIRFTVDGIPFHPIIKEGGYYLLTNLDPGKHQVLLQGASYRDEYLTVTTGSGTGYPEIPVTMKPGDRYPFGREVTRLTLQLKSRKSLAGRQVWIAVRSSLTELRIAQDMIRAGDTAGRLFFPENFRRIALPVNLLVLDKEHSELCRLEELEEPRFSAPLCFDHKRSCCLYPAQCYTADSSGTIHAVFREPAPLEILAQGMPQPLSLTLETGENRQELTLDKKR